MSTFKRSCMATLQGKSGGLNQKGQRSYQAEEYIGSSDLKVPQPGGGSRKRRHFVRCE